MKESKKITFSANMQTDDTERCIRSYGMIKVISRLGEGGGVRGF